MGARAFPTNFERGLSKREYFAALAMQGCLAAESVESGFIPCDSPHDKLVEYAEFYFRMADAMIEASYKNSKTDQLETNKESSYE